MLYYFASVLQTISFSALNGWLCCSVASALSSLRLYCLFWNSFGGVWFCRLVPRSIILYNVYAYALPNPCVFLSRCLYARACLFFSRLSRALHNVSLYFLHGHGCFLVAHLPRAHIFACVSISSCVGPVTSLAYFILSWRTLVHLLITGSSPVCLDR